MNPVPPAPADAAKHYRAIGWRPIQLHGLTEDGFCTCRDGRKPGHEKQAGKHPVDGGWQKAPAMGDDEIDAAWKGWRARANVGIATGSESGFFVLDIDPDNGGREGITRLQADHAPLSAEYVVETGSGGWHLYFEMPADFEPTNRKGGLKEYEGLDVRGSGGQVVAPPSVSGKGTYKVLSNGKPGPAPEWLLDLLRPKAPVAPAPAAAPAQVAFVDGETERLELYAKSVRDLEVGRLQCMADAAAPEGQYQGEPWNETTFMVACALLEIANSPWNAYTPAMAYSDITLYAPRDDGFTDEDVEIRWASALSTVGDRGRPYPPARETSEDMVAGWASEPGVRVDRALLGGATPPPGMVVAADPLDGPDREWPRRPKTDLGNAMRLVDHYGDTIRWVTQAQSWAIYREGHWQLCEAQAIQTLVQSMFEGLLERTEAFSYDPSPRDPDNPDDSERNDFFKWLNTQGMSSRLQACQREAQGRPGIQAKITDFDADDMLFNCANGAVDLRTGELLPADPAHMLMRQSPVEYHPEAVAPLWETFLERVHPDAEMQDYLMRISGYSLTGSVEEQSFFIHHGDGANGKSVWSSIMSTILGEYGQVVAPSTLLANAQEDHPTGVAMMQGKRWLPATETAPGKRLDEERVKNLTGNERVSARFMGKDFFDFLPSGKLHLITNHLPFLSDAKSIWRRIHLIKWGVAIPDEEQDRKLEQKLRDELPGILAWAVRGTLAWQQRALTPPRAAAADLDAYRGDSDAFGDFLRERTMPAPGFKCPSSALYRSYTNWAFDQGIRKPMTQQSFVATMAERKYERYRDSKSRGFLNVAPVNIVVTEPLPWEKAS